jgi:hypothetical protein
LENKTDHLNSMYYHFAVLLLFRPVLRIRIIGSTVVPIDICLQAANNIQNILQTYSELYTLKRTSSLIPYFVLASTTIHLAEGAYSNALKVSSLEAGPVAFAARRNAETEQSDDKRPQYLLDDIIMDFKPGKTKLNPRGTEAIKQATKGLMIMASCLSVAKHALYTVDFFIKRWNLDVAILNIERPPPEVLDRWIRPTASRFSLSTPYMLGIDSILSSIS